MTAGRRQPASGVRPKVAETTASGAAGLVGLAVGLWRDPQELAAQWQRTGSSSPR